MDAAEVTANGFAMPFTSPSYPREPYRCSKREHLILTYRTDPAALEMAVPEPLEITEPLARCEFMHMRSSTGFGRYSGVHLLADLTLNLGEVVHDYLSQAK